MKLHVHGGARIKVQGRSCDVEVMALPEGRQALLGQIPLETFDFWIDVNNQKFVGKTPTRPASWAMPNPAA